MDNINIENRVKEVLADKLNFPIEKISLTSSLQEDLCMDSFGAIEMMFELEEKFSIKVDDEEMKDIKTVQDILVYIKNKLGNSPSPA
jgi:acyl carrier protein